MGRRTSVASWWGGHGIRSRSTIVAVAAVTAALVVIGVGVATVLSQALTASVRRSVVQRANDTAALAADDLDAALATANAPPGDATLLQVLDPSGQVLLASPGISGEPGIVAAGAASQGMLTAEVPDCVRQTAIR